jgi:hypothetical protein
MLKADAASKKRMLNRNDARFFPGVGAGSNYMSLAAKRRRLSMQRTDAASKKHMLKSGDCHGGKAPPRKDKRGVCGIWEPMLRHLGTDASESGMQRTDAAQTT